MTIGEVIRKLRLKSGLTQKKLGELCDINESQIRRYELRLNNSNPKIETLQKIGKALAPYCDDIELLDSFSEYSKNDESIKVLINSILSELVKNNSEFKSSIRDARLKVSDTIIKQNRPLLEKYLLLNKEGQQKALEHIEMLTKVPEYVKVADIMTGVKALTKDIPAKTTVTIEMITDDDKKEE